MKNFSNTPTVPYIEGDGIGPEITTAMMQVVNEAIKEAYGDTRKIDRQEVLAGENAFHKTGKVLPQETIDAIKTHGVGIKWPTHLPVGEKNLRSANVELRKSLDLYACVRPVKHYPGAPSPLADPEGIDLVIFRENIEDLYAGIEFEAGSKGMYTMMKTLEDLWHKRPKEIYNDEIGFGIKAISKQNTDRLNRAALRYAIKNDYHTLSLVHKGNILKYTEGAFRDRGYKLAATEFGEKTITEKQVRTDHAGKTPNGLIQINDRIADNMFQQLTLNPRQFGVITATNLNGDYLSDAAAGLVWGLGIAPGANINYETECAVFEATHGTAPDIAGKWMANPLSIILSAKMMLEHMGRNEAAQLIENSIQKQLKSGGVTGDFYGQLLKEKEHGNLTKLSTQQFTNALCKNLSQ